jgi:hypothetical protein
MRALAVVLLAHACALVVADASTLNEDPEVLEALAQLERLRGMSDNAGSGAIDWGAPWQSASDAHGQQQQPAPAATQQPLPQQQPPPSEATSRAHIPPPMVQGLPSSLGDPGSMIRAQSAAVSDTAWPVPPTCKPAKVLDYAIVTLISSNEGYPAGAIAISAALEVLESEFRRICLVTPTVNAGIRELLRGGGWEVREVAEIACNQVLGPGISPDKYDIGAEYHQKRAKWIPTCTKFHAWALTEFKKVVFLDADTLVLRPIDSLVDHPSDFAAAPDTFPADQFNSGVMVIAPSRPRFEELVEWNRVNGTAEGGDQCLLNDFFGEWFYNAWDEQEAGRLPWIMNIAAAHHTSFRTLARMQARDEPVIVHFVGGESKPWLYMVLKFQNMADRIPHSVQTLLHAWDQMYWLAKTNRICHGAISDDEKAQGKRLLESA